VSFHAQSPWVSYSSIERGVNVTQDVAEMVDELLAEDPTKWGKLASNVQWRRLQLLLLREILLELRKLNYRALEHGEESQ
jgi:hypothetical protein